MAHLGILALCDHYPRLSTDLRRMSPGLRAAIEGRLGPLHRLSVVRVHEGERLGAAACDAWLLSGPLLDGDPPPDLIEAVVAAERADLPLFAVWHGDDLLRRALGQQEEERKRLPLSVRNPVAVFSRRDQLLQWCAAQSRVAPSVDAAAPTGRARPPRGAIVRGLALSTRGLAASLMGAVRLFRARRAGGV